MRTDQKTAWQVEEDLMGWLEGGELVEFLGGGVYHSGLRPWKSRAGDIVVEHLAGEAGVPQRGTVNVLCYLPDVLDGDGYPRKDAARAGAERLADEWADGIAGRGGYHWTLAQPVRTEDDPAIRQHYVYIKLNYKYI